MYNDIAIKIENVNKVYKLYEKPIDRLKESLSLTRKKYHREHYALKNISLNVKKGETVGIIGTNGSGKSTLLKIITGVLNQTTGNVEVNGRISALLELGAGFNPEYTGIENIYLNGTMMGYTKEEINEKIEPISEFADIGEFIYQPVKTYSSGMFARLAFAVAVNVEPEILIVDEALSVGDLFFQNKCFKKFEEIKKSNTTIIFVSHDISSIKQMCSRVLWLNNGIQVMFDNKVDVCAQYTNNEIKLNNDLNNSMRLLDNTEVININNKCNDIVTFPELKFNMDNIVSQNLKIKSFFITDKACNVTNKLQVEDEYSVHIIAEFFHDIDNLIFGFTVENNKGITILGINSFISSGENSIVAKNNEILEVSFKFKLPKIQKGKYLVSPAIARGNQKKHMISTWVHNALEIDIENEGYNLSLIEIDSSINIKKYFKEHVYFIKNKN